MALSDRRGAVWRSPGGICAIADQLSMVREVQIGRCHLLLFRELSSVHDDAVRHRRVLLQKPLLPSGADHCAAGGAGLPTGAPALPPAYLIAAAHDDRERARRVARHRRRLLMLAAASIDWSKLRMPYASRMTKDRTKVHPTRRTAVILK